MAIVAKPLIDLDIRQTLMNETFESYVVSLDFLDGNRKSAARVTDVYLKEMTAMEKGAIVE